MTAQHFRCLKKGFKFPMKTNEQTYLIGQKLEEITVYTEKELTNKCVLLMFNDSTTEPIRLCFFPYELTVTNSTTVV